MITKHFKLSFPDTLGDARRYGVAIARDFVVTKYGPEKDSLEMFSYYWRFYE